MSEYFSQHEHCYSLWDGDDYLGTISRWDWDVICESGQRGLQWVTWLPGYGP